MNFWATRLAGTPAGAPVAAPSAPAPVVGTWFSNPLLNGQQVAPQTQQQAAAAEPLQVLNTTKPLASRHAGTCPGCGGGNYGKTSESTYPRCYDCGYNPRFEQAMAGGGIQTGAEGDATPSQQVASGGGHGSINHFHPETIVAKYGI